MEQALAENEFHPFYETYTRHAPAGNILDSLENQIGAVEDCLRDVNNDVAETLHAPYTWTTKQVVGHMIDAEKIFGCRAHRFACRDEQPVPGMEQNGYVDALDFKSVELAALVEEWVHTRKSNLMFLRRIPAEAFDCVGIADGNPVTVRALSHILFGHVAHHLEILKQRLEGSTS